MSQGLRDHAVYRVEERKAPRTGDTFHHIPGPVPFHAPVWFDPTIHDPRGVFVGDLPHTIKEHEILRSFQTFGPVETIKLRLRPGNGESFAVCCTSHADKYPQDSRLTRTSRTFARKTLCVLYAAW